MRRFWLFAATVLFLVAAALAFEPRAMAYVDPGSGLLLPQTLGAVFAAVAFWFRRQLRGLFTARPESLHSAEPAN